MRRAISGVHSAASVIWKAGTCGRRAISPRRAAEHRESSVGPGRATFRRRDHELWVETDVAIASDDDVELRRVRITNRSSTTRKLDFTSYAEIVLGDAAADAAHPAFEKLFVETEILRDAQAIICERRARSSDESTPWMVHLLVSHGSVKGDFSFETDRMRFVGRGAPVAAQRVVFGTSGRRGSAFDGTFNERHVLAVTQAICDFRRARDITGPVFLGIDTHALSEPACASGLEVLAANGVNVMLATNDEYAPTPVISHAILTYNRVAIT